MNNEEKAIPTVTPIDDEVEISKEDFSKLSYRQKFAVTEYGYLLSVEDAEIVGKMLGSITKEKDILTFCQANGKKVLNFDGSRIITLTNWQAIKIGAIIGLIPMVLSFLFYSAIFSSIEYGVWLSFAFGTPVGLLGGIIGALIGKRLRNGKGVTQFGAILGTVIGIGVGAWLFSGSVVLGF